MIYLGYGSILNIWFGGGRRRQRYSLGIVAFEIILLLANLFASGFPSLHLLRALLCAKTLQCGPIDIMVILKLQLTTCVFCPQLLFWYILSHVLVEL